jgi:short subunit fatty acids transporter
MLAQAVGTLVKLGDRCLPDPCNFVLILTLTVMAATMAVEGHVGLMAAVATDGLYGLVSGAISL